MRADADARNENFPDAGRSEQSHGMKPSVPMVEIANDADAQRVSVVGDFNHWDGRFHPMRLLGASGVWEIFIPGVGEGAHYKFEIRDAHGDRKSTRLNSSHL